MPRSGPCSPWVAGEAVETLPWVQQAVAKLTKDGSSLAGQVDAICAEAAAAASEILYRLSARQFPGECGPVTVRPVSRPVDSDSRSLGARVSPAGWFSSWGLGSGYGSMTPGVVAHYGGVEPPQIQLPFPATKILQVKIDGLLIPPEEYELRDYQTLVRIRPTASSNPTARWGWPTSQIQDLPDTQPGTFSITFMYGQAPPPSGAWAARRLAEAIALPDLGDSTHYPVRVTSLSRQGVSAMIADVEVLKRIPAVEWFLTAHNPKKLQRQASCWSPDMARSRRQAHPSLP